MAAAGPGARIVELGMGDGRIAWPVAAAGGRVIGLDISPDMLAALGRQRPAAVAGALAALQADMHRLPLCARCADAVLAVHVLHLATDWQQVLREAARILRPGGALIQGDDWIDPQSVIGRLRDELRTRALRAAPNVRPPAAGVSQRALLAELGADAPTQEIAAEWTVWISPAERLAQIADKMDAESWVLPPDLFDDLLGQLRAFAAETWPNLDEQQPVTRRFVLTITRGEWRCV